ncbi:MAG TPA: hypothetical protein DCL38_05385 [Lachnospiraceae bacterium]|nr:hypothetical protein [Lachnospiraceae bacterium]
MLNEYYRTHLNKEISGKAGDGDLGEQKLLSELIWQAEGAALRYQKIPPGRKGSCLRHSYPCSFGT